MALSPKLVPLPTSLPTPLPHPVAPRPKEPKEADVDYDALYTASAQPSRPRTAAELLEEKKRKRAAILAKHRQGFPTPVSTLPLSRKSQSATSQPELEDPPNTSVAGPSNTSGFASSTSTSLPGTPAGLPAAVQSLRVLGSATPEIGQSGEQSKTLREGSAAAEETLNVHEHDLFDLTQSNRLAAQDDDSSVRTVSRPAGQDNGEEMSAADYNPDEDLMQEDMRERERLHLDASKTILADQSRMAGIERPVEQVIKVPLEQDTCMLEEDYEDEEQEDEDDMFVVKKKKPRFNNSSAGLRRTEGGPSGFNGGNGGAAKVAYVPVIDRTSDGAMESSTLIVDNFDDPEGYYRVILGELLDAGRYHVHANLGKGMFSNVIRAKDTLDEKKREVAIKIVRSQESM